MRPVFPATLKALLHLRDLLNRVIPGDYLNLGTHLRLDEAALGNTTAGLGTILDQLGLGGLLGGKGKGGGLLGLDGIGKNTANGVTSGILSGLLGGKHKPGKSGSSTSGSGKPGKSGNTLGDLLGALLGGGK